MTDLKIWLLHHYTIGLADPWYLQTRSKLWLMMSDLFHIGYPGNPCFIKLMNCVGHTLELTNFQVIQCMGPYFWGSYCRCRTCPHGIWGSYCNHRTPSGRWNYLLPFLWPLWPHSYTRLRYPSYYYLSKSIRKIKAFSDPPSEKHFHHEIILLRPCIPLAPVALDLHNMLLQKRMKNLPVIPTSYICIPKIVSYCKIHTLELRGSPQAFQKIS